MEEQEQSVERTCRICNNNLGPYARWNQVYCDNPVCKEIGRRTRDKIRRDKGKMHIMLRTCRRCKRSFRPLEESSKRYCKYCIAVGKKGETYHKCMDCGSKISQMKKRCYRCAEKAKTSSVRRANKKVIEETKEIHQKAKEDGITTKNHKIDPKWLAPRGSKQKGKQ